VENGDELAFVPNRQGKIFLTIGDDLHSFLGIKKLGSRANLHTIAE
jgi:hypothetical protein